METLIYLSKSAAIIALFFMVYQLFLQRETNFVTHRFYLMSGVVAAAILPLLIFKTLVYKEMPPVPQMNEDYIISPTLNFVETPVQNASIDWSSFLIYIYIVVSGIFLLRFLVQLVSLHFKLKTFSEFKNNGLSYLKTSEKIAPFSFFKYIVFNPNLHTPQELEMILKHEHAHAKQLHSIDMLLVNLLICLQWFNPFAWVYKRSVESNLEFLADKETVAKNVSRKKYQFTLVRQQINYATPSVATHFYQSNIKKRIIMLNKSTSKNHQALKVAIVLPFLALFLWSFNVKEVVEWKSSKTPSTTFGEISTNPEKNLVPEEKYSEVTISENIPKAVEAEEKSSNTPAAIVEAKLAQINSLDFRITITKNTSPEELAAIKKQMKDEYNVVFEYSELNFNDAGEITGIKLMINDTASGNVSNYHTDSTVPISDIHIIKNEGGGISIGNFKSRRNNAMMQIETEEMNQRMAERQERLAERQKEMAQRLERREEERETRMAKMHSEMDDEQREMREEMMVKREEMLAKREEMREHMRNDRERRMGLDRGYDHALIIDKNTTDETLEKMKTSLKEKDVDFSYKRVKRNTQGEITSIKIEVDKGNGNKSVTSIKGDDDEPIDKIVIEL